MIEPLTIPEVESARKRIIGPVRRTPLVPLHSYDSSPDIHLKLEIHQPVTSFKIRGIFNAVASLSDEERSSGLSTTSSGNTAQALAWCGRYFGVSARSLMPEDAPQTKVDAVRAYGGEPVFVTRDELFRFMREEGWHDEPYAFIHPWTSRNVMIGHGSMALEILEDCPDVQTVIIPVGGGGLIGGVGGTLRLLKPDIKIIGVEPDGCQALHESLRQGKPAAVECHTIADGVAVPYMTEEMYPLIEQIVDDSVLVSEQDVGDTIRMLAFGNRIIAEGAGALATAAALKMPSDERGKTVALVTGGSIDADLLMSILSEN